MKAVNCCVTSRPTKAAASGGPKAFPERQACIALQAPKAQSPINASSPKHSLRRQSVQEHVVRRFMIEIRIHARQLYRFEARELGGEGLRTKAQPAADARSFASESRQSSRRAPPRGSSIDQCRRARSFRPAGEKKNNARIAVQTKPMATPRIRIRCAPRQKQRDTAHACAQHRRARAAQDNRDGRQSSRCQRASSISPIFFDSMQSNRKEQDHYQPGCEIIGMAQRSRRPNDGEHAFPYLIRASRQPWIPPEVLRDPVTGGQRAAPGHRSKQ